MELFLNYNESFLKVKKRYLEIQEKNAEWIESNSKTLEEMRDNNSGKWSEEYQNQAKDVLSDLELFSSRIDRMCEIFSEAEPDIIGMLNRCALFSTYLEDDDSNVFYEHCYNVETYDYASKDLMYNANGHNIIADGCHDALQLTDDESEKASDIAEIIPKLNHVGEGFLSSELESLAKGITKQQRLNNFEDNFNVYVNEVYDFNAKYSSAFVDVVGEYKDFPEFYRITDYEAYLNEHYPHIKEALTNDSTLYDDQGMYGGDQGNIAYNMKNNPAFIAWVRTQEGFENMSDEELAAYFDEMNATGCGYIQVVNAIFYAYEGKPEEFEAKYHIPMYDENGDYNYDKLFFMYYTEVNHKVFIGVSEDDAKAYVDMQKTYYKDHPDEFKEKYGVDYYTSGGFINPKAEQALYDEYEKAESDGKEYIETAGGANTPGTERNRAEYYLEEHGDEVDDYQKMPSINAQEYQQYTDDGYVVMLDADGFQMYNMDGTPAYGGNLVGAHAMVVTGITPDGRYIVSSWGHEYIVDVADAESSSIAVMKIDTEG